LQAESGLIQFTSVNGNGGLHIRLVDQIEYHEDLRSDLDEELAAASVGAHYLAASGSVRCTGCVCSPTTSPSLRTGSSERPR
jgi:hypothetical protein